MLKIEYEIKLNEYGRPYIHLADEYEDKPEDKFLAIELARYFLGTIPNRPDYMKYDITTRNHIEATVPFLGQIGDQMAEIVWNGMIAMGEVDMMLDKTFHFSVIDLDELNSFGDYVLKNDKLYKKVDGLKAFIDTTNEIYLFNDNEWKIIDEL